MTNKDIIKEARRLAATISRLAALTGELTFMQRATLGKARAEARILLDRQGANPLAREVVILRFLADGLGEARLH
jgi:hypothetical protein